jgi:hypothetical protein
VAASDAPNIDVLGTQGAGAGSVVQSHIHEKLWISTDTSVVTTDGSPNTALAVETTTSGTSDADILALWRNGSRVAYFRTGNANGSICFIGDGKNLNFYSASSASFFGASGNPALSIVNQASPSGAYIQLGSATTAGAYLCSVGTNAPLLLFGQGTGGVQISGPVVVAGNGSSLGFYGATPVSKQTGVAATTAAIYAALCNLGLISS